jgi:hypothetical protein
MGNIIPMCRKGRRRNDEIAHGFLDRVGQGPRHGVELTGSYHKGQDQECTRASTEVTKQWCKVCLFNSQDGRKAYRLNDHHSSLYKHTCSFIHPGALHQPCYNGAFWISDL